MSVAGILGSSALSLLSSSAPTPSKALKQEFQQLGQDLKSGNLSAAQSDLTALQQNLTQSASATPLQAAASSTQPASTIPQDFAKLSSDPAIRKFDWCPIGLRFNRAGVSKLSKPGSHRPSSPSSHSLK
jgi:hypothetical protein